MTNLEKPEAEPTRCLAALEVVDDRIRADMPVPIVMSINITVDLVTDALNK